MFLPSATAECTLYKSSRQYRAVAGGLRADGGVHLADRCTDDCWEQCTLDGGYPDECRVICDSQCHPGPRPEYCAPGYKECFRTGLRPHCCPETMKCCHYYDRVTLRDRLDCCGSGEECCGNYSGCYDPRLQQCTPSGIWDCPPNRILCGIVGTSDVVCCEVGEVCTPQGCTPPELVCHGQRCAPGELCTPQGCCPESRTRSSGNCCPPDRVSSQDECCRPGWSCSPSGLLRAG